jgi:hypothetical protein
MLGDALRFLLRTDGFSVRIFFNYIFVAAQETILNVLYVLSFSGYYKAFVPTESRGDIHKGHVTFLPLFLDFIPVEEPCFFDVLLTILLFF